MKRLILFALAGLLAISAARADIIYVQGDVSGTWSADTVMVMGEVRVPPGQTLVIQPGVKVLFAINRKFIVDQNATLLAEGTSADSIRFDALDPSDSWGGIRFLNSNDLSLLSYCHILHGSATGSIPNSYGGAIYSSGCNFTVQFCTIEFCNASNGGGIYCNDSSPTIMHNVISANASIGSSSYGRGGGIHCGGASPIIVENTISANQANTRGGGIECGWGSPIIIGNVISSNNTYTFGYGGGMHGWASGNLMISGNIITGNSAYHGGGLAVISTSTTIMGNLVKSNTAIQHGGGMFLQSGYVTVSNNLIAQNSCDYVGGGICCWSSVAGSIASNYITQNSAEFAGGITIIEPQQLTISMNLIEQNFADSGGGAEIVGTSQPVILTGNQIAFNTAAGYGAGLRLIPSASYPANPVIDKCTIFNNIMATGSGGGVYCRNSSPILTNCILRQNSLGQISQVGSSNMQITYSDIEQAWPGIGNINMNPLFVDSAEHDLRLQMDSPCTDTGDPNPIYNDPDGTRADMGAFYYDQSVMVRILLTPHEIPYLIPATGGSMDYTIRAFNRDSLTHTATVWCDVTLPDSSVYGPVLGPITVTLGAGALLERIRTQNVPAAAPMGVYHYNAYAVVGSETSKDSFLWGKLGAGGLGLDAGEQKWTNTGEPIMDVGASMTGAGLMNQAPTEFALYPCSPNPFNAETAIRYQLPADSHISLRIYDTAGRLVQTVMDGWRGAGTHEVTFDAKDLPSGMYLCQIRAGGFEAVQKVILLK